MAEEILLERDSLKQAIDRVFDGIYSNLAKGELEYLFSVSYKVP